MFEVTYHESREWRDCMNWRPDQFLWIFDVLPFVFALEFSGIFWKFCIFVLIFYVETIWWLLHMSWTWFHWCRDKISRIVCRYLLLLQNKQLSMTGISHLVANQLNSASYTVFRLIFWSYLICYCGHWQLFSCYSYNFLLLRSVHDQFLELVDVEFACGWVLNTFFVSTFPLDVFVEWRYLVENTSAKWISWDSLRNIFSVSVKIDSRWFEWALIYLVLLLILLNGLYILKFNLKVMSN